MVKESLDAFDIYAIVAELKEFEGGYVEKVYNSGDEVFIRVRKDGKHDIFIKNGKWICVTEHREKDMPPSDFAMLLRKHIGRGRIEGINQYNFDRIVIFDIKARERFRLIVELIPKGNIILLDENGVIKGVLIQQKWRHRILKIGEKYIFPPSRVNPFSIKYEEFKEIFTEKDIVRSMAKAGIPGKWAEEICSMASVDKKTPVEKIDEGMLKNLYDAMKSLIKKFESRKFEAVIVDGEDVLPFPIMRYEGRKMERFNKVNEAFDEFYFRFLKKEEKSEDEKERIERQIKMQEDAIKKFMEESERLRKEGDIIFANIDIVNKMLEEKNYIEKDYPKAIVEIPFNGKKIPVEIDVRKNAILNAQEKYERSKKLKEKAKKAKMALEKAREKMVEEKKEEGRKRETKKLWFENFRWFISSHGNLIIGGKDAKSNEKVVKKYMDDDDIYVHADIHGAPSCIIKSTDIEGKKIGIDDDTIQEACQFAVVYSKAWKQYGIASAFWVYPHQVSKSPPAGEFLPRGAFMVRGKRNYVECKMEFAVGIVEIKGMEKVMGGPPSAVKKHARKWIVFEQGEVRQDDVARNVASLFDVPVEWVLSVLPSGGFRKKEEKL